MLQNHVQKETLMGDEKYTINVKQVDIASNYSEHESATEKKKDRKKHPRHAPKSLQHFEEIRDCARNANTILKDKCSPYRFHAYRLNNDIFVDLVILDKNNEIKQTVKKTFKKRTPGLYRRPQKKSAPGFYHPGHVR